MKYFVIEERGRRVLVRADRRVEEEFTREGVWVKSARTDLRGEVGAYEFYDHVHEIVSGLRAGLPCVAVFSSSYRIDELINVAAVMRRRHGVEEWLGRDNVWRAEHRDLDGEVWLPVSEEEVERLQWTAAMPDWFVVHDGGAYPYAVVRTIPSAEEAFTRELRWERSDLLGREDLRVEACGKVIPYDARAAIEIGVRTEWQRAVGGTEYFTLWDKSSFEPRGFSSAIRRTSAREELYVGRRGWVRSMMIRDVESGEFPFCWLLPVTARECEEIIARRSGRRGYQVYLDGDRLPLAVVRVDGDQEEAFAGNLVWEPSDWLGKVAADPDLRAEELLPNWTPESAAFRLATSVRRRLQRTAWQGGHWYYAIFPNRTPVFELVDAHGLVRTNAGTDSYEQAYLDGAWRPTSALDKLRTGDSYDEELPISPDEAQRLMKLLDDR